MDHFGIGAGINAALEIYFAASRGTGRTTSLVDSVKSGDRVVFVSGNQARDFERLCKERGIEVEATICDPSRPDRLFGRGSVPGDGRLIFDHVWLESYYRHAVAEVAIRIDKMQREAGGYGVAHRETARAAREVARFQKYL